MLTEREKEIARELGIPVDKVDPFLSRIREEQKVFKNEYEYDPSLDKVVVIPLFTIPPAAPDCSELVEALKRIAYDSIPRGEDPESYISRLAINALANHAKRMKGGE